MLLVLRGVRLRTLIAILVFLALTFGAVAGGCEPTTSTPEVTTPWLYGGDVYIDNDVCQLPPDGSTEPNDLVAWAFTAFGGGYGGDPNASPCLFSIWIYQESNNIAGLQRGDDVVDDTCGGLIEADSLAFF